MTAKQDRRIKQIRREAETLHSTPGYEIKQWDVKDNEWGTVTVYVEIGLVGDEGTAAEYLCRDRVQLFIGPRGAVKFPVYKRRKDGSFHNYYKQYKGLWLACYEYGRH